MINILILKMVYKPKLERKFLQGAVKALDRSWATIPDNIFNLLIV